MNSVCLLDTSIFCELLDVPNMHAQGQSRRQEFREKAAQGESFLLPLATVLETGNHIGQNGNGDQRFQTAARFVSTVRDALEGNSPFVPAGGFDDAEALILLSLAVFPGHAAGGVGLGDVTIIQEFERQCQLHPGRRVYIWSLDTHLMGYDRPGDLSS